jgi:hypothetical protein
MTAFDSRVRPVIQRGRLLIYPSQATGATQPSATIVFQYNPEQVRRSLAARTGQQGRQGGAREGAAREEALRVMGPPNETINLGIVLDAVDQLEDPDRNRTVAEKGLHPQLATLEMLMYPPTQQLNDDIQRAQRGVVQQTPLDLPLVVLELGPARSAPVQVSSFSVTEEAFDRNFNPIQARIELAARVLTYKDLPRNTLGFDRYLTYQREKERLAGRAVPAAQGA